MPRNSALRLVVLAAALAVGLAVAPALFAQGDQTVERGFAPEKVYDFSSIDQVNLFNGNLSLTIPIGPRFPVGGGLSYGLTLVYNSNVWKIDRRTENEHPGGPSHTYVTAEPQPSDNVALGWRLTLGELYPAGTDGFDRIRYLGEDGSEHLFYNEMHSGENASSFTTRSGESETLSGAIGSFGATLDPHSQSPQSGVTMVFVAPDLGAQETAETLAHELRNANLMLRGLPFSHELTMSETSPGNHEVTFDPNGPVNMVTDAAEREARENYDPFIPPR